MTHKQVMFDFSNINDIHSEDTDIIANYKDHIDVQIEQKLADLINTDKSNDSKILIELWQYIYDRREILLTDTNIINILNKQQKLLPIFESNIEFHDTDEKVLVSKYICVLIVIYCFIHNEIKIRNES
jgi:hypothetical protein